MKTLDQLHTAVTGELHYGLLRAEQEAGLRGIRHRTFDRLAPSTPRRALRAELGRRVYQRFSPGGRLL